MTFKTICTCNKRYTAFNKFLLNSWVIGAVMVANRVYGSFIDVNVLLIPPFTTVSFIIEVLRS